LLALEFGIAQRAQVLGQVADPAVVERESRLPGLFGILEVGAGGGILAERPP
jgi:hypothetical protein